MSIADFSTYASKLANPYERATVMKASISFASDGARAYSINSGGMPTSIATPTTSVALDGTSTGAIDLRAATSLVRRLARVSSFRSGTSGTLWLIDRLVHSGGLSGTTTGAQTTNLPTAALTRYTTGAGVWMALQVFTAVGATATTVTASYTNQAGTTGRTTQAVVFGSAGYGTNASRFITLPFQAGDSGARAVASVTLAATTGTAGNFGVVLYKPLLMIPANLYTDASLSYDSIRQLGGMMPEVLDNAFLGLLWTGTTTTAGTQGMYLDFITE